MGPRSRERGNNRETRGTMLRDIASMGPRSRERGNASLVNRLLQAVETAVFERRHFPNRLTSGIFRFTSAFPSILRP